MTRAQADRSALIATALRLSWLSVAWAALSGTASLTLGVLDHSLAITGVGLNLLGDLAGSLALIWRFGHERGRLHGAETAERVARLVVGTSLTVVAAFLAVQSVRRLADGTGPAADVGPILVAAASVVVLPPLYDTVVPAMAALVLLSVTVPLMDPVVGTCPKAALMSPLAGTAEAPRYCTP